MGRPKIHKNSRNMTVCFDDSMANAIDAVTELLKINKNDFLKTCVDYYILNGTYVNAPRIREVYQHVLMTGEIPEDLYGFYNDLDKRRSRDENIEKISDLLEELVSKLGDTQPRKISVKESDALLKASFFNETSDEVTVDNMVSYMDRFMEENPTLEEGSSKLCFDDVVLISCFLFLRPDDYAIYASESYDFYYSFNDKAGWTKSYAYSELMTFALAVQRYGLEKTIEFNASMKALLKNDAKFFIDKETGCYQLVLSGIPDTLLKSDVVRNLTGKGFKVRSSVYSPVAERMQSVIIEIPKEVHMEPVGEGYDYPENKVDFMQMYLDALNSPEDGLKALRSPNKPKL